VRVRAGPTMSEQDTFREMIHRVRAGEEEAAVQLVRLYEPIIRVVVRRRLTNAGLRRLLDSMDICQSVLASFFVRVTSGQYELDQPEHLLKLLVSMARNKLVSAARKQNAARRGKSRDAASGFDANTVVDPAVTPSEGITHRDLLEKVRSRLSGEERQLVEQRALGRNWTEIAEAIGGTPDGLRMRLSRAIDRITRELGLDV